MHYFLAKTEPDHDYSIDDLAQDGETLWDGIHNALALRHVSTMRPGDRVFIYHSGKEKRIVGLAEVTTGPAPNPDDPHNTWVVRVKFLEKYEDGPVLADFKAIPEFADFALVRQGRLSLMPVPKNIADWILLQVKK